LQLATRLMLPAGPSGGVRDTLGPPPTPVHMPGPTPAPVPVPVPVPVVELMLGLVRVGSRSTGGSGGQRLPAARGVELVPAVTYAVDGLSCEPLPRARLLAVMMRGADASEDDADMDDELDDEDDNDEECAHCGFDILDGE
jgi:hypothetical protein